MESFKAYLSNDLPENFRKLFSTMHFIQIGVFGLVMGLIFGWMYLYNDKEFTKRGTLHNTILYLVFTSKMVILFLCFPITFPIGLIWLSGSQEKKKKSALSVSIENACLAYFGIKK